MSEPRESRAVLWIALGLGAVIAALLFLPKVENPLAPEPLRAFVALRAEGEAAASNGAHRLAAGRPFRLHAVVEAKAWRGENLFFTDAPALVLDGEPVPPERLRPWPEGRLAKVRWFTLEGFAPWFEVASQADLERYAIVETFHPEWGDGWSVDGVVDPKLAQLPATSPFRPLPWGTQRYAVRVELFDAPGALTPSSRVRTPSVEAARAGDPAVTSAVATLDPPLEVLSSRFGLTEAAVEAAAPAAVEAGVAELVERRLAFERTPLLAEHVAAAGGAGAPLSWRRIDVLGSDLRWGDDVAPGDLLQAGSRLVTLFRDEGEPGRLDPEDVVFDLWKGLRVLRLGEVFRSEVEGELELELARPGRGAAG